MQKIFFTSQQEALKFDPTLFEGDWVAVSISDPCAQTPVLSQNFEDILTLKFLDAPDLQGLTNSQAQQLVAFLKKNVFLNKNILIHCFMGTSRSGAIAKYLDAFCLMPRLTTYQYENKQLLQKLLLLQPTLPVINAQVLSHPKETVTPDKTCFECFGQGCDRCNNTGKISPFWYL